MCSLIPEATVFPGVFNLVTSTAAISEHARIDKVMFTGSTLVESSYRLRCPRSCPVNDSAADVIGNAVHEDELSQLLTDRNKYEQGVDNIDSRGVLTTEMVQEVYGAKPKPELVHPLVKL
ncbi:hypothetical protein M378DRAFT_181922 [Amanita muscaria Koide BX008]|uniref:Uncharacterized protein n=1 Tax=Amanita muscaria (strain Koide BX008) TaxID=946122 RepID=A0A0C2W627_AMAMK|nr:hypothetical protein M378DRAFT_181922 [Amanita muscaria Koide BX008]